MSHTPKAYPPWALKRVQDLELEMLLALDAICRDAGLTYFVDAGTCLGAVRHGGFIPWDDDTDVGMPIEDYRTFLRIAPDRLPHGMSLHMVENTPGFSALWAKIYVDHTHFIDEGARQAGCDQGLFLDVFPYVALEGTQRAAARRLHTMQVWQKVMYLRHISSANIPVGARLRAPKVAACVLAHAVLSRATSDAFVRQRHERSLPRETDGQYWANPCTSRPYPFPRDVLFDPVEADFCGHRVFVPHRADAYLEQLYGDYMTLPAPEQRHTHTPLVLDFGDGVNVMCEDEGM